MSTCLWTSIKCDDTGCLRAYHFHRGTQFNSVQWHNSNTHARDTTHVQLPEVHTGITWKWSFAKKETGTQRSIWSFTTFDVFTNRYVNMYVHLTLEFLLTDFIPRQNCMQEVNENGWTYSISLLTCSPPQKNTEDGILKIDWNTNDSRNVSMKSMTPKQKLSMWLPYGSYGAH